MENFFKNLKVEDILNLNGIVYINLNKDRLNQFLSFLKEKKVISNKNKLNLIYKKKNYIFFDGFLKEENIYELISIKDYFALIYKFLNPNSKKKIISDKDILFYINSNISNFDFKNVEVKASNIKELSLEIYNTIVDLKENNIKLNSFQELEFKNDLYKIDLFNFILSYELWKKKNNFIDYYDILNSIVEKDLKAILKSENILINHEILSFLDLFLDLEALTPLEILSLKKILEVKEKFIDENIKSKSLSIFFCDKIILDIKKKIPYFKKLNFQSKEILDFFKSLNVLLDDYKFENSKVVYNYLTKYLEKSSFNLDGGFNFNSKEVGDFNIFQTETFLDEVGMILNYLKSNDLSNKKIGIVVDKKNIDFLIFIFEARNIKFSFIDGRVDKKLIKKILSLLKIIKDPYTSDIEIFYILEELGFLEEEISVLTRKSALKEKSLYRLFENNSKIFKLDELNIKLNSFFDKIAFLKNSYIENKSISNLVSLILEEFRVFLNFEKDLFNLRDKNELESFLLGVFNLEKIYGKGIDFLIDYLVFLSDFDLSLNLIETKFNSNIFLISVENYEKINVNFDVLFVLNLNSDLFVEKINNYLFFNNTSLNYKENLSISEFKFFELIFKTKEDLFLSFHKRESGLIKLPLRFLNNFDLNFLKINENNYDLLKEIERRDFKFKLIQDICLNLFEENLDGVKNLLKILDEDFKNPDKKEKFVINNSSNRSKNEMNNFKGLGRFISDEKNNVKKKEEMRLEDFNSKDSSNFLDIDVMNKKIIEDRKKDLDKISVKENHVYSVSQLNCFKQCPKKYKYQYLLKLKTKPKPYFDFGTSVHSVLEEILPLFNKNLSVEILYSKAVNLLEKNWISKGYKDEKEEQSYFEKGLKIIFDFIETQKEMFGKEKGRSILGLEKDFLIKIKDKSLYGIIDRIDKTEGNYEILDYKTSNSMENDQKLKKNFQLYVYALGCKKLFGKYPKEIGLWYLVFNKIKRVNFDEEILDEIKKEIYEIILEIEKGEFSPKPSKFNCTYCDFSEVCKDSFI